MKRIRYCLGILALLLSLAAGCGKESTKDAQYYIYYINKENTKIVPVPYEGVKGSTEEILEDMIRQLGENPDSADYRKPLGKQVEILSWFLEDGQLQLSLSGSYSQLDNVSEVLCRAALVRTLTQVPEVDSVSIYLGDSPLLDNSGNPMGLLTAEDFVENPGEQINAIQTATITLFFSNDTGDKLVTEVQERHYNSNISLEKLVMEQLLKGPIFGSGKSAIPSGTKLVGVTVLDGVCMVNLDSGFLNQDPEIDEAIVIYSIVNSLVELPNVNKVQISVNGDTSIIYREKFSLNTVYERNLDYLEKKGESSE